MHLPCTYPFIERLNCLEPSLHPPHSSQSHSVSCHWQTLIISHISHLNHWYVLWIIQAHALIQVITTVCDSKRMCLFWPFFPCPSTYSVHGCLLIPIPCTFILHLIENLLKVQPTPKTNHFSFIYPTTFNPPPPKPVDLLSMIYLS